MINLFVWETIVRLMDKCFFKFVGLLQQILVLTPAPFSVVVRALLQENEPMF